MFNKIIDIIPSRAIATRPKRSGGSKISAPKPEQLIDKKYAKDVGRALLQIAQESGYLLADLEKVYGMVREKAPEMGVKTIVSRLSWLLGKGQTALDIQRYNSRITPDSLAKMVCQPEEAVLRIIENGLKAKKIPYRRNELVRMYNFIRKDDLLTLGDFCVERILQEMKWWLLDVGLPLYYFQTNKPEEVATHLVINRSYEIEANEMAQRNGRLYIQREIPRGSVYIGDRSKIPEIEAKVQELLAQKVCDVAAYSTSTDIVIYIVKTDGTLTGELEGGMNSEFLSRSNTGTKNRYRRLFQEKIKSDENLIMDFTEKTSTKEMRLMLAWSLHNNKAFFSRLTRVFEARGLKVTRKYFETITGRDPVGICSLYIPKKELAGYDLWELESDLRDLLILPQNGLRQIFDEEGQTAAEALFANAAANFVHQFISSRYPDLEALKAEFKISNKKVATVQKQLDTGNFPHKLVNQAFLDHSEIRKILYEYFQAKFDPLWQGEALDLEGQYKEIQAAIEEKVNKEIDRHIFNKALFFIKNIERTNFYVPKKNALAFRLKGEFVRESGFEQVPHGVFYVVGSDFRGFHTRFQDIARGGIRILHSRTEDAFIDNSDRVYEEGFGLAATQQLKNKDIAEGGSKGIVFLEYGATKADGVRAFKQYVDSILDLVLPQYQEHIVGHKEEILFFGPDEGSADLMDWACERARERGYRYWKGFTTGKSAYLGGISHIDYAMTTTGVHEYVLQILKKRGLKEETITKVQTGGPDGDLGSNEILISKDKTLAVVDGGGVLYDPNGLDRAELERLARARLDSSHFDASKLGPGGFKVGVSDRNLTLPDGTLVVNGETFRNNFHLDQRMKADLFVPCGGRPRAVNITNWQKLLDAEGKPIFQFIVEGANLFITQDARIKLEERGAILIKDSSANKGGVTSSSYEVLAGLALTDEEFDRMMVVKNDGVVPEFRRTYIEEIIEVIKENARMEFDVLWKEQERTGKTFAELSDLLSEAINSVNGTVISGDLFEDEVLRKKIFASYVPATLLGQIGLDNFMTRVPLNYQKAIFAAELARRSVYHFGIESCSEEFQLMLFVENLKKGQKQG